MKRGLGEWGLDEFLDHPLEVLRGLLKKAAAGGEEEEEEDEDEGYGSSKNC